MIGMKVGNHFIDRYVLGEWETLRAPQSIYKTKDEAAKQVLAFIDEGIKHRHRIRDYWGGVVWETPVDEDVKDGG